MGYQNVGTPRFYIDYLQYAKAIGNKDTTTDHSKHIGLNSSGKTYTITNQYGKVWISPRFINPLPLPRNDIVDGTSTSSGMFVGCLGHNASSAFSTGMAFDVAILYSNGNSSYGTDSEIVNWVARQSPVLLDGFTLVKKINPSSMIDIKGVDCRFYVGSEAQAESINLFAKTVVFGQYFNMPHSPDLSLTMSHSFEGVKQITTKGGSTLSNANYYKPPMWGDRESWELYRDNYENPHYHISGRRSWDLSFSYISDKNLEPYGHDWYEWSSDTVESGATISEPAQDNFFSNVLRYTMGGHLPFIFCPDPRIVFYDLSDGLPPRVPEFAICRFDMSTFKREQVANSVYNMKVKIVESW